MYLIGGYFVTNANYRVYEDRLEAKSLLPFEFYNGRLAFSCGLQCCDVMLGHQHQKSTSARSSG